MQGEVGAEVISILNEVFDLVLNSGVTRLRSKTRLSTLLAYEEEMDARKRQKYENIVEEMKTVSGGETGTEGGKFYFHCFIYVYFTDTKGSHLY